MIDLAAKPVLEVLPDGAGEGSPSSQGAGALGAERGQCWGHGAQQSS